MLFCEVVCVWTTILCFHSNLVKADIAANSSTLATTATLKETSVVNSSQSNENITGFSTQTSSFSAEIVTSSTVSDNQSVRIPIDKDSDEDLSDISVTKTYDVLSWLPKPSEPRSTANLTILPILATLAFLVMLCLKGCTWFRESTKEKDRDSIEADRSFMILHEGDKDYRDIDFRSDLSTPYDTYSSYMSFLRRNNNYDTVTSVRSLQGSRMYDTVTSYRSLIQQRLDNHNNDSVTSYHAFLQRVKAMKDVEIQVELLDEKQHESANNFRHSRRPQRNDIPSPKLRSKMFQNNGSASVLDCLLETSTSSESAPKEKRDVGCGNGEVTREGGVGTAPRHHYEKSPTHNKRSNSPVKQRCHSSPNRKPDSCHNRHCADHQHGSHVPRFKVSFVTDDNRHINDDNSHVFNPNKVPVSIPSVKVDQSAECGKVGSEASLHDS